MTTATHAQDADAHLLDLLVAAWAELLIRDYLARHAEPTDEHGVHGVPARGAYDRHDRGKLHPWH
jgi:hypothetical protein